MEKLFMICIGGKAGRSGIEVNDIRFIAAEAFEDAFAELRRGWFGDALHIDEYMIVNGTDGFAAEITGDAAKAEMALYFVGVGGTTAGTFGEAHEYGLFAADGLLRAEQMGNESLLLSAYDRHIDCAFAVSDRLVAADGGRRYVRLVPGAAAPNEHHSVYIKI